MLSKRILTSTVGLALTASVSLLAGCPGGTTTPVPSASASASASADPSTAPSGSVAPTTAPSGSVAPSSSVAPSATISTQPSGDTGTTSDVKERATFNGKVFDPTQVPVDGATVNAKSVDAQVSWNGEAQVTANGAYVFRNAPVGARIEITVTKDGWTTRNRTEVLKSNLTGDPTANVFNFGGAGAGDGLYSIQDEPEITKLVVNGRTAASATSDDAFVNNAPRVAGPFLPGGLTAVSPALTGVNNGSLDIELTFSEPVRRDDVENFFKVQSQTNFNSRATEFSIDQNLAGVTFTWSNNDATVLVKANKAILANRTGNEARYQVQFTEGFRDKTDKRSLSDRYFRFNPSQINDYHVFSVKNDEEDLKLLGISARDGGAANDTLELRFSEPIEVINQTSAALGLVDPTATGVQDRQLKGMNTAAGAKQTTYLGYSNAAAENKLVYSVARITDIAAPALTGLGGFTAAFDGPSQSANAGLRNAKINGNFVLLEFTPSAFGKNDRVVLKVGGAIDTKVQTPAGSVALSSAAFTTANTAFAASDVIGDPAGRKVDNGNSTTSASVDVDNSQRVSTALEFI